MSSRISWHGPKIGGFRLATELSRVFGDVPDETIFSTDDFNYFLFSQPSCAVIASYALLLHRFQPNVVHFHHYTNIGLEFIAAARRVLSGVRIVVTLHEYLAICHHHGVMVKTGTFALCRRPDDVDCARCFPNIRAQDFARRQAHIRAVLDQANFLIAPSEFLRRRYIAWGIPAWQIVVVENGLEAVPPPPPRLLAKGECRSVFGYFGQIHPFKGLLQLLAAFDQLANMPIAMTQGIRLVIHGAYLEINHPDYIDSFKNFLKRNARRVEFAGPYRRRDQHRLMAAIDWVVVPSIWWENSPLVIEEAFAHKRPVICSNIGAILEKVRSGRDGFHFPFDDPSALAALLVRLAGDPAIWDSLRKTMRSPVGIDGSVARHLELYNDRSFAFSR